METRYNRENVDIQYGDLNPLMGERAGHMTPLDIERSRAIGLGKRVEMIEREIIFDPPKKDVIIEVLDTKKSVEIIKQVVEEDNAVVNGYLHMSIMYTTMKRPPAEESENNNSSNAKHGYSNFNNDSNNENKKKKNNKKEQPKPCCGAVDINLALDGVVRHTSVWIPFSSVIKIEDAREGDICRVINAKVNNNSLKETLMYEDEEEIEEGAVSINAGKEIEQKFIKGIIDKTLVEIELEVRRF